MRRHIGLVLLTALHFTACGDDGGGTTVDADTTPDAFIPAPLGQFPAGFLWGTAMAPYQVEGGLHATDWNQWETICTRCSGEHADDGPDFWTHYETDFANAASMSNNTIRLGIEWARLFPTREQFEAGGPDGVPQPDADALAHYHAIIDSARAHGLQPMVTIIHFSLPSWLNDLTRDDLNGWEDEATPAAMARYAGFLAKEFGDDVDYWITLNEPFVNITGGWISGDVPPGKFLQVDTAVAVGEQMIQAHARAYDAIHAADLVDADGDGQAALVSIAQHSRVFLPKDPNDPRHVAGAVMLRYILNDYFLQAVVNGNIDRNFDFDWDDEGDLKGDPSLAGRLDYIGLNYYGVTLVIDNPNTDVFPLIGLPLMNDLPIQGLPGPINDFGWTIYPQGFRQVIDEIAPYQRPILITENGVADQTDTLRARYLTEHLYVLNKAIDDGVDIRGYYHWSLLDNFEWASGFCPQFGFFSVDHTDPARARTRRPSADVYKRIIDANTVEPALFGEYPTYVTKTQCPRVGL